MARIIDMFPQDETVESLLKRALGEADQCDSAVCILGRKNGTVIIKSTNHLMVNSLGMIENAKFILLADYNKDLEEQDPIDSA